VISDKEPTMKQLFADLPDEARLWVYALARPLSAEESALVVERLDAFLREWNSHGSPVRGGYEILEDRFVMVAGYVEDGVSGCSTDSMVRVMKELRTDFGIDGFDRSLVYFRDVKGAARAVSRADFQALVDARAVDVDTPVFDTTIQFVGDLRRGGFETKFAKAWHASAFSASPPAR
jgi:hypothetical protein